MSFMDTLETYALTSDRDHLAALRRLIMADPTYDPLQSLGPTIAPLLRDGDHRAALARIGRMMPGAFLSPSAHTLLARAHAALGDEVAARREQQFTELALHSLLGDSPGTAHSPITVLRIEDEYDVLVARGTRSIGQRQVLDERGALDVHTLEDGEEIWFRLLWRTDMAR